MLPVLFHVTLLSTALLTEVPSNTLRKLCFSVSVRAVVYLAVQFLFARVLSKSSLPSFPKTCVLNVERKTLSNKASCIIK